MLTAAQARELAGPTPQERVDAIAPLIEKAAKEKQRQVALHDPFWVHEGYSKTPAYKEATKILEKLGYKVRFHYMDGSFLKRKVDMYTIIEW